MLLGEIGVDKEGVSASSPPAGVDRIFPAPGPADDFVE